MEEYFIDGEEIKIPYSWQNLQKIIEKWGGVFMVIGGVSSGKTTFVKFVASSLLKIGKKVAIIDADIGQSWIGPPTTIGAILLPKKEEPMNTLRPDYMEFVGILSPSLDVENYLGSLKVLFERVKKENPFAIIVDTTGLVAGIEGLKLKVRKAELLKPTLVTAFKKNGEMEHIINALLEKKINVYTLRAPKETKERSMEKRREYREEMFRRYFNEANELKLRSPEENFEINTLVGILNRDGETLALGIVVQREKEDLILYTPLKEIIEPCYIKKSEIKISITGREI